MTNVKFIEKLAKSIEDGSQKTLTENDTFQFGCTACGKCCFGQDILLNPTDVYLMVRSGFAKKAGIRTTADLFEKEYLRLIRGHSSRAPLCVIHVEEAGGPCPFLMPAIDVADESTVKKIAKHTKDGLQPSEIVERLGLKITRFLCGLHEDRSKPAVCKSSPLGRVYGKEGSRYIVVPPVPDCPGMKVETKQVVKDWIRDTKLDVQYRHSSWFHEFLMGHHDDFKRMSDEVVYLLGEILFDPDGVLMKSGVAPDGVPTATCENVDAYMEFLKGFAETYMKMIQKNDLHSAEDIKKFLGR
jgi:hypothetical protein